MFGSWSMWVFRLSRNFPVNIGYIISRNSTCNPTLCLFQPMVLLHKTIFWGGYSFKQDTTLTIDDECDLLLSFWKIMDPAEKKSAVEAFESHGVWNVSCIQEVRCRFHIETKDFQNLCVCVNLVLDKPELLELVVP